MGQAQTPNSTGNNSPLRSKKIATPFTLNGPCQIKELELSLNTKCNLRCTNCGFIVPDQPKPFSTDVGFEEHTHSLRLLKSIGVKVGKIVVVGGEVALHRNLNSDLKVIRTIGLADEIEVVTNGLYPQGVDAETLEVIDSLVISDYVRTECFERIWTDYVSTLHGNCSIHFRRKDSWDDWKTPVTMSEAETQQAWKTCFYRNYDITLERGRIFSCSRIAKHKRDAEGLKLVESTKIEDVQNYLNANNPHPSCSTCTPVAGLPSVEVAIQSDGRDVALSKAATKHMRQIINRAQK